MIAVMMARQLLRGDALQHEELGTLAKAIISEQAAEIAQMRRWSNTWFGRSCGEEDMMSGGSTMGGSGS